MTTYQKAWLFAILCAALTPLVLLIFFWGFFWLAGYLGLIGFGLLMLVLCIAPSIYAVFFAFKCPDCGTSVFETKARRSFLGRPFPSRHCIQCGRDLNLPGNEQRPEVPK
jgi:hypothetical protein